MDGIGLVVSYITLHGWNRVSGTTLLCLDGIGLVVATLLCLDGIALVVATLLYMDLA